MIWYVYDTAQECFESGYHVFQKEQATKEQATLKGTSYSGQATNALVSLFTKQ